MKLLILGGSSSRNSGGVFDTARMMGARLHRDNAINVEYLMFDDEYSPEDKTQYSALPVHSYRVKGPKKLGLSTNLYQQMKSIRPDIVHTQSLWMYLSYVNKKYNQQTGTPYIISPHGMLDKWQLKQSFWKDLKKNIVLTLYERKHLEGAACLHALCKEEFDAIRAFGLNNPVAIIPNGIELHPSTFYRRNSTKKQLLFLSRIHPKKGLDNLLLAWSLLSANHGWQLVIAGETRDTIYMQSLLDKAKDLKIEDSVAFVGGQYGEAKQSCFVNSDAFILPSFSEGLPVAVLEAWSYQLPVVMTPECNITDGFIHNAALRIEANAENIRDGIEQLFSLTSDKRKEMGHQGYCLVREKYSWARVAESMAQVYNWVLGKNEKPDFVFS